MFHRRALTVCILFIALHATSLLAESKAITLRSVGAAGDGRTDDRAVIEAALVKANGAPVDGEGATYRVHGNIELKCDLNLRNATFVQTMEPVDITKFIPSAQGKGKLNVEPESALRAMVGKLPLMLASGLAWYSDDPELSAADQQAVLPSVYVRTIAATGTKDKPVSVHLEKVKVLRGNHPETGSYEAGGIILDFASPVVLTDVEVTGDGKGWGINITNSANIKLTRLNIHDMIWAPYPGDNIFTTTSLKSIKEDFGWNNFPIYQYRAARKRFVRVRIQEQLAGLQIRDCRDVEFLDSKVAKLQTKIGDRLYSLQADGVTVANVANIHVKNCHFSEVWEGIDFTANSGSDFLYEDCTATDTFTFGFKLAHPKQNGKMVNCTSYRAGNAGFVLEPEMENIEYVGCNAFETGANGFWTKDDGSRLMTIGGFRQFTSQVLTNPMHVHFTKCTAINEASPGAMDYGIVCEGGINPAERDITATNCSAKGAKVKDIQGVVIK